MEKQSSSDRWNLASTYVLHPLKTMVFQFWRVRVQARVWSREETEEQEYKKLELTQS